MFEAEGSRSLDRGIAAAKAGNKSTARLHLLEAARLLPEESLCWLWLAWVADRPLDAVGLLQKALAINPDLEVAWAGLRWAQALTSSPTATVSSRTALVERTAAIEVDTAILVAAEVPEATAPVELEPERTLAADSTVEVAGLATGELPPTLEASTSIEDEEDAFTVVDEEEFLPTRELLKAPLAVQDSPRPQAPSTWRVLADFSNDEEKVAAKEPEVEAEDDFELVTEPPRTAAVAGRIEPASPSLELELVDDEPADEPTPIPILTPIPIPTPRMVEAPEPPAPRLEDESPRSTIMVVDDSPTVRRLVSITLTGGGYRVISAEDGVEAVSLIGKDRPDLILMDINMPRLDGYKLCKLIKSHEKTRQIPVIMLSGKDGFFDKARGKLVGCSDYMTKPFEPGSLLQEVGRHLPAVAVASR